MVGFTTKTVHVETKSEDAGAITTPITQASTFIQKSPGVFKGYEYSRSGNPTRDTFEKYVAKLENGQYGQAFSSGSSATATVQHLLNSGEEILSIDDVYGGTQRYFNKVMQNTNNIKTIYNSFADEKTLREAITEKTKQVWQETPTNPTLRISDISMITSVCHEYNILVVVDNTFMSPFFQKPQDLGADIVVHSISKYINGHSDVIGGVVITNNKEQYTRLSFLQNSLGCILSPFDSYLVQRGAKTLSQRMERHNYNAQKIAEYLEKHPLIEKVLYPGLLSHPQYDIAKKQTSGNSGIVSFYIDGDLKDTKIFLENQKIFSIAESLGAVESLAEHPAIMTHASVPLDIRKKLNISDTLVRLSVGIEDIDDLLLDIENALKAVEYSRTSVRERDREKV